MDVLTTDSVCNSAHMKETVELCVLAMALRQRERQLFDKAQAYAVSESM